MLVFRDWRHFSARCQTSNQRRQVGRDLWRSLVQLSAPSRANRSQVMCSGPCSVNFRKSSRTEIPPPPWALAQSTNSPSEDFSPCPAGLSLGAACVGCLSPLRWALDKSGSSSSDSPLQRMVVRSLFSLLTSRLRNTWFCQSLLYHVSFQIFLHFCCLKDFLHHSLQHSSHGSYLIVSP